MDVDERDIAMTTRWLITLLCTITTASPASALTECHAMSGDRAVAVIELYTSEGCDSCPPADRWLGGLKLDPGSAVALAFHVDYWDRLGWQDRFASAAYTRRQYEQAGRQREELVYTPQILLQGREFVTWRDGTRAAAALAAIGAKRPKANIELVAQRADRDSLLVDLRVSVPDTRDRTNAVVAVALTQDGLSSEVKAGENAGKRLTHEHVVRAWTPDLPLGAGGELRKSVRLPLPGDHGPLSIVALAEDRTTGEVLQALALPVCTP
jgi:hypothetical protein